jgi:hypothetical protein
MKRQRNAGKTFGSDVDSRIRLHRMCEPCRPGFADEIDRWAEAPDAISSSNDACSVRGKTVSTLTK